MYVKIPKKSVTKMAIIKTDCKMTLAQVVSKYKCNYAINGGLYDMKTGKVNPIPLRIDGKTIATSSEGYWMMAWNTGSDLCMIHSRDMAKWKNAIACATMLKDGQNTIFTYTSAQGGCRGRTAFGDDDDNVILLVTTDKKEPMFPNTLRSKCKQIGAKNMLMLDCGGSSQMYNNGTYLQAEKRKVAYWICIWTETESTSTTSTSASKQKCPYKEPTTNVRNGSRGESSRWTQWMLNEVNNAGLVVDGIFGNKSVIALKNFQKKYGLTADGISGARTRTMLNKAFNNN